MKRILPRYSYIPMLSVLLFNLLTFYGTRLLNRSWPHISVTTGLDNLIPVIPVAVTVYIFAYITWLIGYGVIARDSRGLCYEILSGELVAKFLTMICFLALPTVMERPELAGDDLFSRMLRLIYYLDTPDNLFPSVHCLENWIIFRGTLRCEKVTPGYKVAAGVAAVLVFASTLLVKQHVVLDVVGAVVIGELGLWIGRKIRAARFLERLNRMLRLDGVAPYKKERKE